ncbi:MAG: HAMP domain-containing sensor histidine kinase [Myxococcales bacterium]
MRARDDFLSVASHELKTPLTTLQLQFHLLLKDPGATAPMPLDRLRAKLEVADRQVRRLSGLVESLLDVTRIRAGRLDIQLEDGVDLGGVAGEAASRLQLQAERSRTPLDVRAAAGATGRWDRQRLDQVVSNLVSNALKYGAGKPVTVTVTADDGRARLEVRDEGIGMSAEDQARIFERFERAVADHDYAGLGLGLWITQQIVHRLGGEISVESAPGRGAAFVVDLPRAGPVGSEP